MENSLLLQIVVFVVPVMITIITAVTVAVWVLLGEIADNAGAIAEAPGRMLRALLFA